MVDFNSNVHRCTTWAQVEGNAAYGRSYDSRPLRIKGENLWVLSGSTAQSMLYGHRDEFANWIIAEQAARTERYMKQSIRDSSEDITFIIARDGNALLAIQRNGKIHVNERARTGLPRYADAIRRLEPIYKNLFETNPGHYLIQPDEFPSHGGVMPEAK